jgi:hypothetical protein
VTMNRIPPELTERTKDTVISGDLNLVYLFSNIHQIILKVR